MSALAARPRERGVLRTVGIFSAIGLGGVAVFLVVIGHTQKQVQVGLLIGLWGVMLGAFTLFGPRHGSSPREVDDTGSARDARDDSERLSAERREHELQLEVMLRREVERVLRSELSELRGEVAGLRSDVLEKVNGQLRLERIETTRVISSDIDEMQHEVRRLAVSRNNAAAAIEAAQGFPPATLVEASPHASAPLPYLFAAPPAGQAIPAAPAIAPPAAAHSATPPAARAAGLGSLRASLPAVRPLCSPGRPRRLPAPVRAASARAGSGPVAGAFAARQPTASRPERGASPGTGAAE